MPSYLVEHSEGVLTVAFAPDSPADNNVLVVDAAARIGELIKSGQVGGGELIRVNGPASMPVAMVLAHAVCHLYQAVACFDPKLQQYVVVIAHGDLYRVGDLLD